MTDRREPPRRPPDAPHGERDATHGEDDATRAQIERSVERLFGENVDAAAHAAAERGEWPGRLWQSVVDAGLCAAPTRAAHAGIETSWADAWPILRGLGYWQVPLPLAETMIGAMLLSKAGLEPPPGAITLVEAGTDARLAVGGAPEHPTLAGHADRVPWARHCRWALVSTPGSDALFLVELAQPGNVRVSAGTNLAGEPRDQVAFSDARVALCIDDPLPGLDEPIRHLGALARSAAIAGALESALEQSVRYANERIQFGRPIAAFQAIQHSLAILAAETVAARTSALVAAASAPSIAAGDASRAGFDIAVAKLRCSEAATRGAPIAHQVHGAIGFTREHPLHRATCRLWAWRAEHGSDAQWAERLGGAAIAAGSRDLWPALTRRKFD
ncbi:MAG: acyl-CoA/acyl-ACP dehydrogenase [Burkholderiaceae bacterium]|nr:acyl-CoA/acyl-ACP dehydrogenase [Burkholderiaceae bacterium]